MSRRRAPYPPVNESTPACRDPWVDPEWFFPKSGESTLRGKAVCQACPLKGRCLAYALDHDVNGIWGGTSAEDRRRIRRSRGITPEPVLSYHQRPKARKPPPRRRPEVAAPPAAHGPFPVEIRRVGEP